MWLKRMIQMSFLSVKFFFFDSKIRMYEMQKIRSSFLEDYSVVFLYNFL